MLYFCIFGLKFACVAEFFPDTTMSLLENLGLRGNVVKISIFVNQSNINQPEFNLAQIWLKCLGKLFYKFTVIADLS